MKKYLFLLCLVFTLPNTRLFGQNETIRVTVLNVRVTSTQDCDPNSWPVPESSDLSDFGFNFKVGDNYGNSNINPNSNIIVGGNIFYQDEHNGSFIASTPDNRFNPSNGIIYNYSFCNLSTYTFYLDWIGYESDGGSNPTSGNIEGSTGVIRNPLTLPSANSSNTQIFSTGGSSGGCSQGYEITIKIERSGSPLSLTAVASQTTICAGDEITLSASGNASAITWDNGVINGVPFTPTQATTYTVSGNGPPGSGNNTSCSVEDQITIIVNQKPAANPLTGDNVICIGGASKLYQVSPVLSATYNWSIPAEFTKLAGGSPSDFFVSLQFGTITSGQDLAVSITNSDNCTGEVESLTITVNEKPSISAISGVSSVCEEQTNVSYSVLDTPSVNYTWTIPPGASIVSGQGTNVITVNFGNTSGNIKVVPTSQSSGCDGTETSISIDVIPIPIVIANASETTICKGDEIILTGSGADSYSWNNGVTDNVAFAPNTTTTYTVTGNTNGCDASDDITIEVISLDNNIVVNNNTMTALEMDGNYSWYTCNGTLIESNNNPSYTFEESGEYYVEITKDGCTVQSECTTFLILGLKSNVNNQILVYPIPAKSVVIVDLNKVYRNIKANLFSTNGKLISTQYLQNRDQIEVDVKRLKNGTFILKIQADNIVLTKSIIVSN